MADFRPFLSMTFLRRTVTFFRVAILLFLSGFAILAAAPQKKDDTPAEQLPPELRGAKVYHFPDEKKSGKPMENPAIYKNLTYQDINFERLLLNLYVSIKPVERAATIRKIYFQDVRVNGVPVHIETFDQEFKLSKKEAVDLPAPLKCALVFSDLDSVAPVKEIVNQGKLQVTGQSFIEVKLNPLEKLAVRAKRLVLPVQLKEEVPLQMFSGNPLLQTAAITILDTLSDPSSAAASALGKQHVAKLSEDRGLESFGKPSLYFLYCEYALRNPQTQATEKFSQSGTGFVVSPEGKLLTAKRVVQPWKFDPQVALLMDRFQLELDPQSYRLAAWPVDVPLSPDGQPDFEKASSTEKQTLKLLETAPDRMEKKDCQDPDSGERATLSLHAPGEGDLAVLQLVGGKFQPLALADAATAVGPDVKTALLAFPFGLNQARTNAQIIHVRAAREGPLITLDHQLNPGEIGAPLLTAEGKVLGLASGANQCIPIEAVRTLIQ